MPAPVDSREAIELPAFSPSADAAARVVVANGDALRSMPLAMGRVYDAAGYPGATDSDKLAAAAAAVAADPDLDATSGGGLDWAKPRPVFRVSRPMTRTGDLPIPSNVHVDCLAPIVFSSGGLKIGTAQVDSYLMEHRIKVKRATFDTDGGAGSVGVEFVGGLLASAVHIDSFGFAYGLKMGSKGNQYWNVVRLGIVTCAKACVWLHNAGGADFGFANSNTFIEGHPGANHSDPAQQVGVLITSAVGVPGPDANRFINQDWQVKGHLVRAEAACSVYLINARWEIVAGSPPDLRSAAWANNDFAKIVFANDPQFVSDPPIDQEPSQRFYVAALRGSYMGRPYDFELARLEPRDANYTLHPNAGGSAPAGQTVVRVPGWSWSDFGMGTFHAHSNTVGALLTDGALAPSGRYLTKRLNTRAFKHFIVRVASDATPERQEWTFALRCFDQAGNVLTPTVADYPGEVADGADVWAGGPRGGVPPSLTVDGTSKVVYPQNALVAGITDELVLRPSGKFGLTAEPGIVRSTCVVTGKNGGGGTVETVSDADRDGVLKTGGGTVRGFVDYASGEIVYDGTAGVVSADVAYDFAFSAVEVMVSERVARVDFGLGGGAAAPVIRGVSILTAGVFRERLAGHERALAAPQAGATATDPDPWAKDVAYGEPAYGEFEPGRPLAKALVGAGEPTRYLVRAAGSIAPSAWATATFYNVGDFRSRSGSNYACFQAHTSATANAPGTGADWEEYWENLGTAAADLVADATIA